MAVGHVPARASTGPARSAAGERVEEGRAVARLTDLGWGQRLRTLLAAGAADAPADDAAARRVRRGAGRAGAGPTGRWRWSRCRRCAGRCSSRRWPSISPGWAGCATSARSALVDDVPRGEPGGNSAFRLAAVDGRFTVPPELASALADLDGPVLLVDDLVDSRWTMTVAGGLLRQAGAPAVLPFALAVAA